MHGGQQLGEGIVVRPHGAPGSAAAEDQLPHLRQAPLRAQLGHVAVGLHALQLSLRLGHRPGQEAAAGEGDEDIALETKHCGAVKTAK